MSRAVNEALINGISSELADIDSCVVIGPRGLTVQEVDGLRTRLRDKNVRMRVVKNSLACRAFESTQFKGLGRVLDGPSAILFGGEGAIAISKLIVAEAIAAKDKILIHGGFSEGELLDAEGIDTLAKAPTRDEALSMVMGNFFGPVNELARSMDNLLTEVHGLIEALETERGGEGDQAT